MQLHNINATREMTFSCKRGHLCPQHWRVHECDHVHAVAVQQTSCTDATTPQLPFLHTGKLWAIHPTLPPGTAASSSGRWNKLLLRSQGIRGGHKRNAWSHPIPIQSKALLSCQLSDNTTVLCSSNMCTSLYQPTVPKEKKMKEAEQPFCNNFSS